MIKRCVKCGVVLREGERVRVDVGSIYHELGSKVHYSISKDIGDADPDTLRHEVCLRGYDEQQTI